MGKFTATILLSPFKLLAIILLLLAMGIVNSVEWVENNIGIQVDWIEKLLHW